MSSLPLCPCACACHPSTAATAATATTTAIVECRCSCASTDEHITSDYWITRLPDGGIHVASTRAAAVEPAAYYRDLCIPYDLIHEFATLRAAGDTSSDRVRELESLLGCTLNNASGVCEICRAQTVCEGICESCFDQLVETVSDSHDPLGLADRVSCNYYAL
jgi:hypothetical protein